MIIFSVNKINDGEHTLQFLDRSQAWGRGKRAHQNARGQPKCSHLCPGVLKRSWEAAQELSLEHVPTGWRRELLDGAKRQAPENSAPAQQPATEMRLRSGPALAAKWPSHH